MEEKLLSEQYADVVTEPADMCKLMEEWAPQRWEQTLKARRAESAMTDTERDDREKGVRAYYNENATVDARRNRADKLMHYEVVGIPDRLAEMLVNDEDRKDTTAAESLKVSMDGGRKLIVLSGPVGTGKTVAAARIAADNFGSSMFVTAFKMARINAYDESDVNDLERSFVVVLDDLGSEYQDEKGFARFLVEGVINSRYDAGLLTIATTNLPVKEFAARYGERIADRIRETGAFIEIAEESMRQ